MTFFAFKNAAGKVTALSLHNGPPDGCVSVEIEGDRPVWANSMLEPAIEAGALIWIDPRTLDQIKADKWTSIKAERTRREAGTFSAVGHVFNVDPVNLVGAALDAYLAKQNGEIYAQAWVLADNSAVPLTADQMIAAGRACKAYMAGLWVISQTLRGQITAAQDAAAVAAVVWPA